MIEDLGDRWRIGLRGSPVLAVSRTEAALSVTFAGEVVLTVAGPVLLTDGPETAPGAVAVAGEEWGRLVGATVLSAIVFKYGSLRLVFSTGHHLNVRGSEPGMEASLRQPGVFRWSSRQGVSAMEALGTED
ncbi:DUF6188 family protein [Streptomyces virginiae]|uniref:DUF6188 family protein n=1 Tax=Streptomyces virginiae TaxID=1961 RepID=UPI00224EB857|nr:DUF6188 family protein [Streptomyces virginiae]MCX4962402.1 DUF6188 family protein [Streptomyces virginiae]MCX5179649.1 DUF6188 family protein [Streptomyces virginiae]